MSASHNNLKNGLVPEDHVNELGVFLQKHSPQLAGIPEKYWASLYYKLTEQVFDAGNIFKILKIVSENDTDDDEEEKSEERIDRMSAEATFSWKVVLNSAKPLKVAQPEHIYLIDHSWTYWPKDARAHLQQIPGLLERMSSLMDINADDLTKEGLTEQVLNKMWLYNQVYSFGHLQMGSDDAMPVWYIMDEFGSKIQHSDDPSFKIAPFYHVTEQLCYTVLWPLKDLDVGDEVTRDYIQRELPSLERRCCLIPWIPADMTSIDFFPTEPEDDYFKEFQMGECLPDEDVVPISFGPDQIVKVFIDYNSIQEHVTDPRFAIVDNPEDADALFVKQSWKQFAGLEKLINQFPNECVITFKDLIAIVGHWSDPDRVDKENFEHGPAWLPVTYNINTELPKFISYFQQREKRNLNNTWICKPWNLARALDTHITDQLSYIIRLRESGPKIACKYIENPVLIHFDDVGDVKFDIRYILLLSSVSPLKLYAYRIFWLRFANKPYSLDSLDDYEKHFTVMNYEDDFPLRQVHYDDFMPIFNNQYPEFGWEDTEKKIFAMFRSLFLAATSKPYPKCIAPSPNSRAMYAADLMLKWTKDDSGNRSIQPVLCEINFCPDCDRACQYHPRFANDVLSCLFLDDIEDRPITEI